jgi:hypothetical protein
MWVIDIATQRLADMHRLMCNTTCTSTVLEPKWDKNTYSNMKV